MSADSLWHITPHAMEGFQVRDDSGRIVARCSLAADAEAIVREHNAAVIQLQYPDRERLHRIPVLAARWRPATTVRAES